MTAPQGIQGLPHAALITGVAVGYFAVVAAIAAWAARRTRSASDFFVAGRSLGLFPMAIAAMAATVSGFSFIGGPGLLYRTGLGAVHIVLPLSVTASMSAWVLARRMRALAELRGVYTVPEAIGVRYRSRAAQGLAAAAIVVAVVGYMATNVLALGVVVDGVFGTGLAAGVVIGTGITLAYSASGGILAGVYADLFQGIVMAAASVLVFAYVLAAGETVGGIAPAILAAEPQFLGPWGTGTPLAALSLFLVFSLGTLGQPHVIHKFYMIRDPRQLRWFPAVMTAAMVLTQLLFIGVGLVVKALVLRGELPPPARPDDVTPAFLLGFTPLLLAALVFSGVAAAIMSTVNSFLSVGAAALVRDLPAALGRQVGDELWWGRVSTLAIGLLAAVVAVQSDTLVAFLGIFGWGVFASAIVPSLAIGLNWTGATREGAIASIVSGLVTTVVLESLAWFGRYRLPAGMSASVISLVVSLLAFLVVSRLTSRRPGQAPDADIRALIEA